MSGIVGGMASGIELLLQVLDNPERYRTKLDEIRTAAAEADALIALAGPASEIPHLRAQLDKELEAARIAVLNADAAAIKRVGEASAQATRLLEAAEAKAEETTATAEARLAQANSALSSAAVAMGEAKEAQAVARKETEVLYKYQAQIATLEASVREREVEVEAEKERLAQVAQRFQASLVA